MITKLQTCGQRGALQHRWESEFDRIHVWNPAGANSSTRRWLERIRHYRVLAASGPPQHFEGG